MYIFDQEIIEIEIIMPNIWLISIDGLCLFDLFNMTIPISILTNKHWSASFFFAKNALITFYHVLSKPWSTFCKIAIIKGDGFLIIRFFLKCSLIYLNFWWTYLNNQFRKRYFRGFQKQAWNPILCFAFYRFIFIVKNLNCCLNM